ncbi:Hypothetical protein SRAE_1000034550 [Strongyloides ratti]|uniref:Uncharacterized protein n=1 Tax=Strongyloides ratti TaxID=34506 RepID=A0A090KXC7_STRRB|nr:Hypothetical protein SRAE_1000034550 [Strongyloides ratti]CEF62071.1 Hypothetical protein SRAE_1000034550 [Strongyloides ratti]
MTIKPEFSKIQQNFINKSKKGNDNEVNIYETRKILPNTITNSDVNSKSSIIKKIKVHDIEKSGNGKLKLFGKLQLTIKDIFFLLQYGVLEKSLYFNFIIGIIVFFLSCILIFYTSSITYFNILIIGLDFSFISSVTLITLILNNPYISIISFCGSIVFINGFGICICLITTLIYEEEYLYNHILIYFLWLIIFVISLIQLLCIIHRTFIKISINDFYKAITNEDEKIRNEK